MVEASRPKKGYNRRMLRDNKAVRAAMTPEQRRKRPEHHVVHDYANLVSSGLLITDRKSNDALLKIAPVNSHVWHAFYMNCREKCWDLYKGDWPDFRSELRARLDDIVKEAAAAAPIYTEIVKREKWSKHILDESCPLEATGKLAAEIDVMKVTTSRD